jgi:hypothetical protein
MRITKLFILLPLFAAMLLPTPTHAATEATLHFTGPRTAVVGQIIHVRGLLTTSVPINVVQGALSYSPDQLQVSSISIGKSILRYWQQGPTAETTGRIQFLGGLPTPGFQGTNGELLDITFKTKREGKAVVAFLSESDVLANDGNGTSVPTARASFEIDIIKPTPGAPEPTPEPPTENRDTTPPTDLELLIGHDSHLFDGAWFAVFQAVDGESGIDHYEIAETDPSTGEPAASEWVPATSPYKLTRQDERTKVFLKAIDKAGNSARISQEHNPQPQRDFSILVLMLLLVIILLLSLISLHINISSWRKSGKTSGSVQN